MIYDVRSTPVQKVCPLSCGIKRCQTCTPKNVPVIAHHETLLTADSLQTLFEFHCCPIPSRFCCGAQRKKEERGQLSFATDPDFMALNTYRSTKRSRETAIISHKETRKLEESAKAREREHLPMGRRPLCKKTIGRAL